MKNIIMYVGFVTIKCPILNPDLNEILNISVTATNVKFFQNQTTARGRINVAKMFRQIEYLTLVL
jgi:hypothetical protein